MDVFAPSNALNNFSNIIFEFCDPKNPYRHFRIGKKVIFIELHILE